MPFLHEIVRYLASARAHASDYLVADAPAGVKKAPGVATIADASQRGAERRIVVNVDPRESDTGRLSVDDFRSAVTRLKNEASVERRIDARQQEDRQHLWQYAMAIMILVLAGEGLLAARTV